MPDWEKLFKAWGIRSYKLKNNFKNNKEFLKNFNRKGPAIFIVPTDPEQTYFPKIKSRITKSGSMESNPLHKMSPELTDEEEDSFLKYLK